MMEKKNMSKPSALQDVKTDMELSGAYRWILKLLFKFFVYCLLFKFKVIGYFVNPSCGNSNRGTFF